MLLSQARLVRQRAMATAMLYPEPEKGGRGKVSAAKNTLAASGFSRQLLDQARLVLSEAPDLVKESSRETLIFSS